MKLFQAFQEVLERTAEPVKLPDNYGIDLPPAGTLQESVELRTPALSATYSDIHEIEHAAKALVCVAAEFFKLEATALFNSAESDIARQE